MQRANDCPQQEKNARASEACRRAQLYQPTDPIVFSVGQSVETTGSEDAALAVVHRSFELLLAFTQKNVPGLQLIVTEHANVRDLWFQDVCWTLGAVRWGVCL